LITGGDCLNFVVKPSSEGLSRSIRTKCIRPQDIRPSGIRACTSVFSITRFAIIAVQENSEQSEAKVANDISNADRGVGVKRESIVVVTIEVQYVCNGRQDAQTRIDEKAKQDNQFKRHGGFVWF
jgi:hypothetical protein